MMVITAPDVPEKLKLPFEVDPRLPEVLKAELGPGSFEVLLFTREDLNTYVRILGKSCQLSNVRAYALKVRIAADVQVLEATQYRDDIEPGPGVQVFLQAAEGISRRPR